MDMHFLMYLATQKAKQELVFVITSYCYQCPFQNGLWISIYKKKNTVRNHVLTCPSVQLLVQSSFLLMLCLLLESEIQYLRKKK